MGGCTGATFRGSVYRGEGFAFRVPEPPSTWKRIEVDGKALSFVDASSGTLVAASGRCKVDGEDVPLRSLVQHLFLQFTERDVVLEEVVPFDGREAMHTVVLAKLDGVPKQFDVWVLKKDGCVYDLYCIADPAEFDDAVGPFRTFAQGFSTVRVDADCRCSRACATEERSSAAFAHGSTRAAALYAARATLGQLPRSHGPDRPPAV